MLSRVQHLYPEASGLLFKAEGVTVTVYLKDQVWKLGSVHLTELAYQVLLPPGGVWDKYTYFISTSEAREGALPQQASGVNEKAPKSGGGGGSVPEFKAGREQAGGTGGVSVEASKAEGWVGSFAKKFGEKEIKQAVQAYISRQGEGPAKVWI